MNILVDRMPVSITVDGVDVPINWDFRSCLKIILAFEDPDLTPTEKAAVMLHNLFPSRPTDVRAAMEAGVQFLNGGISGEGSDGPKVYSFEKDSRAIFSAFQQTHGVNLETADMHWWRFLALFMDLGSETTFCNLVSLRSRVKTGRATKEEREAAHRMGDAFEVPDGPKTMEELEQEREFMQMLKGANNG